MKKVWQEYSYDINFMKNNKFKTKTSPTQMRNSIQLINELIKDMKFTNNINSIKGYLSQYGTFCDREFYYVQDFSPFYHLSEKQQLMVFLTDIYYAYQDCTRNNSNLYVKQLQGEAMLFLYSFGLYENTIKVWFMQSIRNKLLTKLSEKYDLSKYFVPHQFNVNAYNHILNTEIKINPEIIENEETTYYGKKLMIYKNYLFPLERGLEYKLGKSNRHIYYDEKVNVFFDNNGNRIHTNSKDGKEIKGQLALINKLVQNV